MSPDQREHDGAVQIGRGESGEPVDFRIALRVEGRWQGDAMAFGEEPERRVSLTALLSELSRERTDGVV